MTNDIYNEKIYLNKDSKALEELYKKREQYSLLHAIERAQYNNLITEYNRFLRIFSDFLKTLDLNNSLEYALAISYLIHNGYLTYNKKFKNIENKEEINTRYGTTILKGYGCCRNFSDITRDVMMLLDYFSKKFYCYLGTLNQVKNYRNRQANHIINLIEYDGVKYGIDLFNDCLLYRFRSSFILDLVSDNNYIRLANKPYYEIIMGESDIDDILNEIKDYSNESKKSVISPLEYGKIRRDVITYLNSRKNELDDFHNETMEMKENIVRRMRM